MKTPLNKLLLLSCLGITMGTLLSSCVDPYHESGQASVRVTTYRPGYEVRALPSGYRTEIIGGTRYYNDNGTYYQSRSGRYVVVEAPGSRYQSSRSRHEGSYNRHDRPGERRDVVITSLPRGYREINHRNGRYYQHNDVYYQQRGSGYVIVSRPY